MRQVTKPRKSESEKTEKVKPTAEDIEEFGEDKKEKQSTAVVSGAKTGQQLHYIHLSSMSSNIVSRRGRGFPQGCSTILP